MLTRHFGLESAMCGIMYPSRSLDLTGSVAVDVLSGGNRVLPIRPVDGNNLIVAVRPNPIRKYKQERVVNLKLAVSDGRTFHVDVRGGRKVNRAVSSDNDPCSNI